MRINHNFFSNLSFYLAENHLGKTNTNPSVGCVIVKNKSVISSGVTSLKGRPHAEYNALNKKLNFSGCNMYVTLQPCAHYGQTPPCTNIIKKKRIKNVYYSFDDPDPRTFRKTKKNLYKSKISFRKINFKNNDFYKYYFLNKNKKLPYLDAKIAISKDYFTISKKSKWITNLRSRTATHLIRSKYDSILSTSYSINKDNSLLNCRIEGFDNNKPDLIIIDRKLRLRKKLKLFSLPSKRKIYLFTSSNDKKKISFFKKKKIKVIKIKDLENKKDFFHLLKKIYQFGKRRVLIETGLTFLKELLKYNIINNMYIFRSSTKLNKNGYNNIKSDYLKKFSLNNKINVNLNGDELFKLRMK